MKTISIRFACTFLLILSLMLSAVIVMVPAAQGVRHDKSERIIELANNQPVPEPKFVLRAYKGHLALWREGAAAPYRVLSSELWLLSEEDRAAVETGIIVDTQQALDRLLEDLGAEE